MRKRIMEHGLVACLGVTLGLAAVAGEEAPERKEITKSTFDTLDANEDGAVTRDELKSFPSLAAKFDAADADSNGALTLAEFGNLLADSR